MVTRQPSVTEAAHLICISITKDYRLDCMKYWELHYGETFKLAIEKEVRRIWGARANRPKS